MAVSDLEFSTVIAIRLASRIPVQARGFGGRHASAISPRQLKEVIPVANLNVGSIATLGVLVGEVRR